MDHLAIHLAGISSLTFSAFRPSHNHIRDGDAGLSLCCPIVFHFGLDVVINVAQFAHLFFTEVSLEDEDDQIRN